MEEGLFGAWAFLQSSYTTKRIRAALEAGVKQIEYRVKVYKPHNKPGFAVRTYYHESTLDVNPVFFPDLL